MPVTTVHDPNGNLIDVTHPEGATDEEIIKYAQDNAPVTASGIGAAAATGLGKGTAAAVGAPADIASAAGYYRDKYIVNPIVNALGGKPFSEEELNHTPIKNAIGSENINKGIQSVFGEYHKPQNMAEKVAETAASFVPGTLAIPGGGIVGNAIRYGAVPGAISEIAGNVPGIQGTAWEPYARTGAALAASIPNPGRLVNPIPISPARAKSIETLKNEGVTSLTAGQKTGNESLRYLESAAGNAPMAGGKTHAIQEEGQKQFTEAAVSRAGAGPDATPEVLAANQKRLGNEFERLSAAHNLKPDNQFVNDVVDAVKDYRKVPPSQQKAIVQGYVDDIVQHINSGDMPGPMYQEMRSRLSRQSKALRQSDPTLSDTLRGLRDALDNAMDRSIPAADREAWNTARREYGAQKVIEKAASRAGEATAEGQITPANLRNTISAENRGAYARGQGPFAELARAGAHVMTPLPNSGTAYHSNALSLLGLANQFTGGAIPAVTGRLLMSRPAQAYLASQIPGQQMIGQLLGANTPRNLTAQQILMIEALSHPSETRPQIR